MLISSLSLLEIYFFFNLIFLFIHISFHSFFSIFLYSSTCCLSFLLYFILFIHVHVIISYKFFYFFLSCSFILSILPFPFFHFVAILFMFLSPLISYFLLPFSLILCSFPLSFILHFYFIHYFPFTRHFLQYYLFSLFASPLYPFFLSCTPLQFNITFTFSTSFYFHFLFFFAFFPSRYFLFLSFLDILLVSIYTFFFLFPLYVSFVLCLCSSIYLSFNFGSCHHVHYIMYYTYRGQHWLNSGSRSQRLDNFLSCYYKSNITFIQLTNPIAVIVGKPLNYGLRWLIIDIA